MYMYDLPSSMLIAQSTLTTALCVSCHASPQQNRGRQLLRLFHYARRRLAKPTGGAVGEGVPQDKSIWSAGCTIEDIKIMQA